MFLLEADNVVSGYGSAAVLHGASLSVEEGKLTAVFGPNGGGKSTLAKTIAGLLPVSQGVIRFAGGDLSKMRAERISRSGVLLVPQEGNVFANLTVEENIRLGAALRKSHNVRETVSEAYEMFPKLKQCTSQVAGTLSGGERQMLAIGSAVVARPKLLILDEPTSGLAPVVVHQLIEQALKYASTGATVLWMVGDSIDAILPHVDKAILMQHGRCVNVWAKADMPRGQELADLYMGNIH